MQAEFPTLKHVLVAGEPGAGQLALDALPEDPEVDGRSAAVRRRDDAALGWHHISVQADSSHARRLRADARLCGAAAGSPIARCSWQSCRWVTTTTWPRRHAGTFYYGGTVVLASGTGVDDVFAGWCRRKK
jgi:hypothetical protein